MKLNSKKLRIKTSAETINLDASSKDRSINNFIFWKHK